MIGPDLDKPRTGRPGAAILEMMDPGDTVFYGGKPMVGFITVLQSTILR